MTMPELLFMGSKQSGLSALGKILERLPKKHICGILCPDDTADERSKLPAFESLARKHALPLHVVKSGKGTSDLIGHYAPHTVLVHGWYRLLPVSSFPGTKFLGFHFSPLPEYRGSAPLVWQIINGKDLIGVSFFVLTDGMDDGDIVDQRFFNLSVDESVGDAIAKANCLVHEMLEDFIPRWLLGAVATRPQETTPASYCGMRLPLDGLIDWNKPSELIHDFIRAQSRPYPGAFSHMPDGRTVRFWKTKIEQRKFYGVAGSVVEVGSGFVIIACGSGALRILHSEIDGEVQAQLIPSALGSLRLRFT
jgi:methionyl-tRNA formyltransferase